MRWTQTEDAKGRRRGARQRTQRSRTKDQELEQVCIYLYCVNISLENWFAVDYVLYNVYFISYLLLQKKDW